MQAVPEQPTTIPRWLPNAISVARIGLVPVWGLCAEWCRDAVIQEQVATAEALRHWTILVLVTIGVSDVVDGYLARRFGLTSRVGATLDALADKLAQVSLLLFFTMRGAPAFPSTPAWFLALILARDLILGIGWLLVRRRLGGVRVVHRAHGKLASVLLFVLLIALSADAPTSWSDPLIALISVIVAISTAAYIRDGVNQLRHGAEA